MGKLGKPTTEVSFSLLNELRDRYQVSFKELEQSLWTAMRKEFATVLRMVLERIDLDLMMVRDPGRFESKSIEGRTLDTMLGTELHFERRRYLDRQTGKYVYLLDEVLGLSERQRISPGLHEAMLTQAVTTNSYRKAAESIEQLLGFPAVSHESIRQAVISVGSGIEQANKEALEDPQGQRKVRFLFAEADGLHIPLQRDSKRSVEEKVLTLHEGWKPRYRGDHQLVGLNQFRTTTTKEVWNQMSRFAYSQYDIDEDTIVIINGDRAPWIRKGISYFPNAMYQIDRFHLKRDLRRLFSSHPKERKAVFKALDSADPTGATFLAELAKATRVLDPKLGEQATALLKDLATMPEATVDYRLRLKAKGISTEGLRSLGAAEAQMDRLSDRMKRGRSWGRQGEAAMLEILCARFSGRFDAIVERIEDWCQESTKAGLALKGVAKRAARSVMKAELSIPTGGTPIDSSGRSASSGLSNLMHRINESGMPVCS